MSMDISEKEVFQESSKTARRIRRKTSGFKPLIEIRSGSREEFFHGKWF